MFGSILYFFDTPIVNSILIFLTVSTLLYAIKPKWMFKKDGRMRQFGFGKTKTFFTFPIVVFGLTMISYIILKVIYHSHSDTPIEENDVKQVGHGRKPHKIHRHHNHRLHKKHRFIHSP